jgi:molecular chaperone Hsp33
MNDHYIRALSTSGGIRIITCSTAELARQVCSLQGSSPTVSVALGRGLVAGALMGGLLKGNQRLAMKFEGNGPMAKMIIESEGDGSVRGCVGNPAAEAEPVDGRWNVPGVLGNAGFLTVSKDLGMGGEPYHGMVQLQSSEIGDDLALYLTESEQIPSAVGLGVSLDRDGTVELCGGFLIQALPKADKGEISLLLERISTMPPITTFLAAGGPEALLQYLVGEIPYTPLETRELFFRCGCSREKVEHALHSLGAAELNDMRKKDGHAEVTCEFCRQSYRFEAEDLERLAALSTVSTPR